MRIYSDMDGYLANFIQQFIDWFKLPVLHSDMTSYDKCFDLLYKHTGLTINQGWEILDDINFWFGIKPYPWFKDVVEVMNEFDHRWTIMTCMPPFRVLGIRGKQKWIEEYLPEVYKKRRMAFVCGRKHLHAHPGNILIDDSPQEVNTFKGDKFNGNAILIPQPWNTGDPVYSMGDYVWEQLREIKRNYEQNNLKTERLLLKVKSFIDQHTQ
jgi:5'(3')-deoxyribonucleotidase